MSENLCSEICVSKIAGIDSRLEASNKDVFCRYIVFSSSSERCSMNSFFGKIGDFALQCRNFIKTLVKGSWFLKDILKRILGELYL